MAKHKDEVFLCGGYFYVPSDDNFAALKRDLQSDVKILVEDIGSSDKVSPMDKALYFSLFPKLTPKPLSKKIYEMDTYDHNDLLKKELRRKRRNSKKVRTSYKTDKKNHPKLNFYVKKYKRKGQCSFVSTTTAENSFTSSGITESNNLSEVCTPEIHSEDEKHSLMKTDLSPKKFACPCIGAILEDLMFTYLNELKEKKNQGFMVLKSAVYADVDEESETDIININRKTRQTNKFIPDVAFAEVPKTLESQPDDVNLTWSELPNSTKNHQGNFFKEVKEPLHNQINNNCEEKNEACNLPDYEDDEQQSECHNSGILQDTKRHEVEDPQESEFEWQDSRASDDNKVESRYCEKPKEQVYEKFSKQNMEFPELSLSQSPDNHSEKSNSTSEGCSNFIFESPQVWKSQSTLLTVSAAEEHVLELSLGEEDASILSSNGERNDSRQRKQANDLSETEDGWRNGIENAQSTASSHYYPEPEGKPPRSPSWSPSSSNKEVGYRDWDIMNIGDGITLIEAVEKVISISKDIRKADMHKFKGGLCFRWMRSLPCTANPCTFRHNMRHHCELKMKSMSVPTILKYIVAFRSDRMFPEMAVEGFHIFTKKCLPELWFRFLAFFVFHVKHPKDKPIISFWQCALNHFSTTDENYDETKGAREMLNIFSNCHPLQKWKISTFLQVLSEFPLNVPFTLRLLEPVLTMNLKNAPLLSVIESCEKNSDDVRDIGKRIVPLIDVSQLSVTDTKLLLKFCNLLAQAGEQKVSEDLKERLKDQILHFDEAQPDLIKSYQKGFVNEPSSPGGRLYVKADLVASKRPADSCTKVLSSKNPRLELLGSPLPITEEVIGSPRPRLLPSIQAFQTADFSKKLEIIESNLNTFKFEFVGVALNHINENIPKFSEQIVKVIFAMPIGVEELMNLLKTLISLCDSKGASEILASIAITVIYNFVNVEDWTNAYVILSLCQNKNIDLPKGTVCNVKEGLFSQSRLAMLLVEVYTSYDRFQEAFSLLEKYSLFLTNRLFWSLKSEETDVLVRNKLIDNVLARLVEKRKPQLAYKFCVQIWDSQKFIHIPVDLRKFINDVAILLLNVNDKEVLNLFETFRTEIQLKFTVLRAIIICFVRHGQVDAAKRLVKLYSQIIYKIPDIKNRALFINVKSFWSEEELFLLFEVFFDKLAQWTFSEMAEKESPNANDSLQVAVNMEVLEFRQETKIKPQILTEIKSSLEDTESRLKQIFETKFTPPIGYTVSSKLIHINETSLWDHLSYRRSKGGNTPF